MASVPLENSVFLGVARSVLGRRWELRTVDETEVAALVRDTRTSDAVARVLAARGINASGASTFLRPTLRASMPDPSTLTDMDKAVARLVAAVQSGEKITIFGDYDVDGATSAAVALRPAFISPTAGPKGTVPMHPRCAGYRRKAAKSLSRWIAVLLLLKP